MAPMKKRAAKTRSKPAAKKPARKRAAAAPKPRPSKIAVGAAAPAFTLADADGNPVRLADLEGRWKVLYFYPKADTPGCTVEACEFTAAMPDFRGLDAEVLGVSPDEPAALARFRMKYGLGVRLLGDPSRETLRAYGAWGLKKLYGREFEGVIRSTVLVDPEGRVAHHWKAVRAAGHAGHVKDRLAALRAGK